MPAAPDYQAVCQRFIAGLEAAARSHETGDFPAISAGYDQLDGELPRNAGPEFDKLHVALHFWDGWIDARNHDCDTIQASQRLTGHVSLAGS